MRRGVTRRGEVCGDGTCGDETAMATKTVAAAAMAAMAKAADHTTAVIGQAGPVGGERVSLPLGIEGRLVAGWRGKNPTQIVPPPPTSDS